MKKVAVFLLSLLLFVCAPSGCGDSDKKVTKGRFLSETTYVNESVDLTFEKYAEYRYLSEDEIQQAIENAKRRGEVDISTEWIREIEFFAVDSLGGSSVIFGLSDLRETEQEDLTVEEYAKQGKAEILETQEGKEIRYAFYEDREVVLGGISYLRMEATVYNDNASAKQYVYLRKVGKHMVVLCATSAMRSATDFQYMICRGTQYVRSEDKESYYFEKLGEYEEERFELPAKYEGVPVTKIGAKAFLGRKVKSILLPDSITEIEEGAFWGCGVETMVLPSRITKINGNLFRECESLTSVTVPAGVDFIGKNAFKGCTALESALFEVPEGWSAGSKSFTKEELSNSTLAAKALQENLSLWTKRAA